jgi:hypothetical protein
VCDGARGPFAPRVRVQRHLSDRRPRDPELIGRFAQRLRARDPQVVDDLQQMPGVWDASFLEPLLVLHEAGDRTVPWVLEQRGFPHRGDREAERRLSAPLLAELGAPGKVFVAGLAEPSASLLRHQLASLMDDLGCTCDRDVVPALVPWLDCEVLVEGPPEQVLGGVRAGRRFGDLAYEVIRRVRGEVPWRIDGGGEAADVSEPGAGAVGMRRRRVEIGDAGGVPSVEHRGRCIAALRRELAAGT